MMMMMMMIFQPQQPPGSARCQGRRTLCSSHSLTPGIVRVARYSFGAIAVSGAVQDVFDEYVEMMGDTRAAISPPQRNPHLHVVPDRPLDNSTIFAQICAVKGTAVMVAADHKAVDHNIRAEVGIVLSNKNNKPGL